MRISNQPFIDATSRNVPQSESTVTSSKVEKNSGKVAEQEIVNNDILEVDVNEENKEKISLAVGSLNEFLDISYKSSKFVFHEGLDRYYVQLVDKETEEVIREIPPKKLLDAFYEMQKLVGMIVDEKI